MCVLIGKGGVGKDRVVARLLELEPRVTRVLQYATRAPRGGEREGVDYRFITEDELGEQQRRGRVLLLEEFPPKGVYALLDDDQVDERSNRAYVVITTPEGAHRLVDRYGADQVSVVHLTAADDARLLRMFSRAMATDQDFHEVCRRFVADDEDFSRERFIKLGLTDDRVVNSSVDDCVDELLRRLGLRRRRWLSELPASVAQAADEQQPRRMVVHGTSWGGGQHGDGRRTQGDPGAGGRRARSGAGRYAGGQRAQGQRAGRRDSAARRADDRRRPR